MPKKCVCGSAPDPAGGAYSVPPDPLAGNGGGATLKGTVGRGEETRVGRGGNGRRERGRGKRKTASGIHLLPAVTFFAGKPAGN